MPTAAPAGMSADDFIARMRLDKKNLDERIRLVLLSALGEACIHDRTPPDALRAFIESYPRA